MKGVRVTTIERTIVDSINMLGKVMDVEELVKCLELIYMVNEKKLLEILDAYKKEVFYRKVGYILSYYKDEFKLSDILFDICLSKSKVSNGGYLANNDKDNLVFDSKWGLYVYPNLMNISDKRGNQDV